MFRFGREACVRKRRSLVIQVFDAPRQSCFLACPAGAF
jgi:hypothetical protein